MQMLPQGTNNNEFWHIILTWHICIGTYFISNIITKNTGWFTMIAHHNSFKFWFFEFLNIGRYVLKYHILKFSGFFVGTY